MRVLVCGGRDYEDRESAFKALDHADSKRPISIVIHGGATGADRLAGEWASSRGLHSAVVTPRWDELGKSAGMVRNAAMMLLQPEAVIAFPGGAGTKGMVYIAKRAHVPVWEPYPNRAVGRPTQGAENAPEAAAGPSESHPDPSAPPQAPAEVDLLGGEVGEPRPSGVEQIHSDS